MSEIVRFNDKSIIASVAESSIYVSVSNSVVSLSTLIPAGANYCQIRAEASSSTTATVVARYWVDGNTPTAIKGVPIANLDVIAMGPQEVKNAKFISVDANTQLLLITWYSV